MLNWGTHQFPRIYGCKFWNPHQTLLNFNIMHITSLWYTLCIYKYKYKLGTLDTLQRHLGILDTLLYTYYPRYIIELPRPPIFFIHQFHLKAWHHGAWAEASHANCGPWTWQHGVFFCRRFCHNHCMLELILQLATFRSIYIEILISMCLWHFCLLFWSV